MALHTRAGANVIARPRGGSMSNPNVFCASNANNNMLSASLSITLIVSLHVQYAICDMLSLLSSIAWNTQIK